VKINDALFGVLLFALGVAVLFHVQSFPRIPGQQVGPALFPGVVAAGLAVCGVVLVISGLRERRGGGPWFEVHAWIGSQRHVAAFFVVILGVVAYILLADKLGFLLLAPVLLLAWFVALGVRFVPAVVTAVVVTFAIWFAFYKLLRVPLPWGLLTDYAF
jgi:putative tricarboxylic transport membrane protein